MTVHTIMLPDMRQRGAPRSVVWDDEAGTVMGDHGSVPWMQGILAKPTPVKIIRIGGVATLRDPGHDPADFLFLLSEAHYEVLYEPLRSTLPPVFDGVEVTSFEGEPLPEGAVA